MSELADRRAENIAREGRLLLDRISARTDALIAAGNQDAAKENYYASVELLKAIIDDRTSAIASILDRVENR